MFTPLELGSGFFWEDDWHLATVIFLMVVTSELSLYDVKRPALDVGLKLACDPAVPR